MAVKLLGQGRKMTTMVLMILKIIILYWKEYNCLRTTS